MDKEEYEVSLSYIIYLFVLGPAGSGRGPQEAIFVKMSALL
jgi:hypothetical protein